MRVYSRLRRDGRSRVVVSHGKPLGPLSLSAGLSRNGRRELVRSCESEADQRWCNGTLPAAGRAVCHSFGSDRTREISTDSNSGRAGNGVKAIDMSDEGKGKK